MKQIKKELSKESIYDTECISKVQSKYILDYNNIKSQN